MNAYDELMGKIKDIALIGTSLGAIYWDLETYMPPAGIQLRSEQISVLSRVGHEKSTSPEVGKLLEAAEKEQDSMNEVQKRNLFLARREYDIDTKIPTELVGRLMKQQAIATDIWKKAKAAKDWKMFEPELQKLIDLSREKEEIAMKVKGISSIYDSMLDQFERNMTAEMIDKVFSQLRNRLVPLVQKCADASENVDASFLSRKIPIDVQRKIATDLGNLIGYDTTSDKAGGRIDET
ncbi:MAG: hypothetical protein ACW97O_12305, partial [Candidatus Thorarchaeota archaeon]